MSITVSDPTRWFVFQYPRSFDEDSDESFFQSPYSNPYHTWDKDDYDANYDRETSYVNHTAFKNSFFYNSLHEYKLPYLFQTECIQQEYDIEGNYGKILGYENELYEHTLMEMVDVDISRAFIQRGLEYFKKGSKYLPLFLDFHYEVYNGNLSEWLEHIEQIFKNINEYVEWNTPKLIILKLCKNANNWIAEKRKELAALTNPLPTEEPTNKTTTLTTQQPIEVTTPESEETRIELDKKGHKIVMLKELGIIDDIKQRLKNKNPNISAKEISIFLSSVMGIKSETIRKALSGYEQNTKDDPKTKLAITKVKSELIKLGINLAT